MAVFSMDPSDRTCPICGKWNPIVGPVGELVIHGTDIIGTIVYASKGILKISLQHIEPDKDQLELDIRYQTVQQIKKSIRGIIKERVPVYMNKKDIVVTLK